MATVRKHSTLLKPRSVFWRGFVHLVMASALLAVAILAVASAAYAGVTKIQIISRGPAFGGYSFPKVGTYERIVGKAFGEINPNDRHNKTIVDIGLAPRNARGNVEYSFDFYILKPTDLSNGNHKVFYEAPNRGNKQFGNFNRSRGGNDPAAASDPGTSFLAPQGYTMVWSGWDFGAGTDNSNFNLTITLPIAKNRDGSSITGPAYEYIVSPGASYELNYAPATLDQTKATLTHRVHLDDAPQIVPASGWEYTNHGNAIRLAAGRDSFYPERHLRILVHSERSDREWNRLRRGARFQFVSALCDRGQRGDEESADRRRDAHLYLHEFTAGTDAERLPQSGIQRG